MKRHAWRIAAAAGIGVLGASPPAEATQLLLPASALVETERPAGWSAGVYGGYDRRFFDIDGASLDLDITRAGARLGANLAPFLHVAAHLGYSRAAGLAIRGEGGLEWGFEAYARLLDLVVREVDPVYGAERLIFGVSGGYRWSESNFPTEIFHWHERRVVPTFTYWRDLRGTPGPWVLDMTGMAAHLGVGFSDLRGTRGTLPVAGRRNFALSTGLDLLWRRGWVSRLRGMFYDITDRELGIELGYLF